MPLIILHRCFQTERKHHFTESLIKDKKLTSDVYAWNGSQELTGAFRISVTANPGGNLNDVEKAVFEAFDIFEKEGFSEEDLTRIKARNETNFYNNFSSVLSKAFTLGVIPDV